MAKETLPPEEKSLEARHSYEPGSKIYLRGVYGCCVGTLLNGLPGCIQTILTMAHIAKFWPQGHAARKSLHEGQMTGPRIFKRPQLR